MSGRLYSGVLSAALPAARGAAVVLTVQPRFLDIQHASWRVEGLELLESPQLQLTHIHKKCNHEENATLYTIDDDI